MNSSINEAALRAAVEQALAVGALIFIASNFLGNTVSLLRGSLAHLSARGAAKTVRHYAGLLEQQTVLDAVTPEEKLAIFNVWFDSHARAVRAEQEAKEVWASRWNEVGLFLRWIGALGALLFAVFRIWVL